MFGSIGHAACNTKSLSQGAGGNIDEVQPDNDVVFARGSCCRCKVYLGVGWPSRSELIFRRFINSEAGKSPAWYKKVSTDHFEPTVSSTSAQAAYKIGAAWPLERMNRSLAGCFGSDTEYRITL